MKKYSVIACLILMFCGNIVAATSPVDTLYPKMPIVSGGVKVQANMSHIWAHNVTGGVTTSPSFSGDIGGFIDFNISRHFLIQFNLLVAGERCIVKEGNSANPLQSIGVGIPVYMLGRFGNPDKGYFYFGGGPYTEFVIWARMNGADGPFNPFHHVVGTDELSGEEVLALSDNHSGLGIYLGYEFPFGLQINAAYQYSLSDIFAFEHDKGMSVHPQKAMLGFAWRFGRAK